MSHMVVKADCADGECQLCRALQSHACADTPPRLHRGGSGEGRGYSTPAYHTYIVGVGVCRAHPSVDA